MEAAKSRTVAARRAPWAVAKRVWCEFFADSVPTVAGGITFFMLLAIFPAIGSLVSIYGLIADRADVGRNLASLSGFLPDGAVTVLGAELKRLTGQPPATLSLAFLGSTSVALWSASGSFKALVEGLNVAFEVPETRGFWRLSLNALIFTAAGLTFALASITIGMALPGVIETIGIGAALTTLFSIAVWPLAFIACALMLAIVYRFGPNRAHPQWRWITWGSSIATILWLISTQIFAWYALYFAGYAQVYGELGALVGFLTWIWLSTMIVLLGAEINSELELAKHR